MWKRRIRLLACAALAVTALASWLPHEARAAGETPAEKLARGKREIAAKRWIEAGAVLRDAAMNHPDDDAGRAAVRLYFEAMGSQASLLPDSVGASVLADIERDVPALVKLYCDDGRVKAHPEPCLIAVEVRRDLLRSHRAVTESVFRPAQKHFEARARVDLAVWTDAGKIVCEAKLPACERMGRLLYEAAENFAYAGLPGEASAVRTTLLDPRYHLDKGEPARRAILDTAAQFKAAALFEEAPIWYERFAREAPAAERAPEALEQALVLRLALGQDAEAREDAERFEKRYGLTHPKMANRIAVRMASAAAARGDHGEVRARLTRAMSRIERAGGVDSRILAHAILGRSFAQSGELAKAAAEYESVRRAWKKPQVEITDIYSDGQELRLAEVIEAVGEAAFFFAERKREEAMRVVMPPFTGPSTREAILNHLERKIAPWLRKKQRMIEAAQASYENVIRIEPVPPPRWVIASAARVGGLWDALMRESRSFPEPPPLPHDAELRALYYSRIDTTADVLKQKAKAASVLCYDQSVKHRHFDDFSRSCEAWLAVHYSYSYDVLEELHDAPSRASSAFWGQPVVPAGDSP